MPNDDPDLKTLNYGLACVTLIIGWIIGIASGFILNLHGEIL